MRNVSDKHESYHFANSPEPRDQVRGRRVRRDGEEKWCAARTNDAPSLKGGGREGSLRDCTTPTLILPLTGGGKGNGKRGRSREKSDLEFYDYWPYAKRKMPVPAGRRWPSGSRPTDRNYEIQSPLNPKRVAGRAHPELVPVATRDHGNRVGPLGIMEVDGQVQVRGSILLEHRVDRTSSRDHQGCVDRNWEFFSHGITTRAFYELDEAQDF